ncbi:MAG: GNAT family N-acetyltransferase [Thermoanaerobaculia bacterium]
MNVSPVALTGRHIRLDPMTIEHAGPLARVGLAPELWRLQPASITNLGEMNAYVSAALADQNRGVSLPFVIADHATGEIIGTTRYMEIAPAHRRLEIGATWLAPARQHTGANTEAKLLLLTHAFETLKAIRVVFKTETANAQSRAALLRIGAVEEGTFRQHLIADSGRRRDMVYFAILESEWPGVKEKLQGLSR